MSVVEDAITEIEATLADLAPQHEGLRDYYSLNLLEPTKVQVRASIEVYDKRVALLNQALAALKALDTDGHPEIPVREVSEEVYTDLTHNSSTIDAALTTFAEVAPPVPASELGLSAGDKEQKADEPKTAAHAHARKGRHA